MTGKKDRTRQTAQKDAPLNEGEGNRTAARQFNEAQQGFVRSAKVGEKAKEAARAVEGKESEALREAELVGKRHAADEDPQVKR
jgi:hypothetical protein